MIRASELSMVGDKFQIRVKQGRWQHAQKTTHMTAGDLSGICETWSIQRKTWRGQGGSRRSSCECVRHSACDSLPVFGTLPRSLSERRPNVSSSLVFGLMELLVTVHVGVKVCCWDLRTSHVTSHASSCCWVCCEIQMVSMAVYVDEDQHVGIKHVPACQWER